MEIEITQRFKPFSHLPGARLILPGSSMRLQIFPTRFIVEDLKGPDPLHLATVELPFLGPLEQFTIAQDLEQGYVRVWGKSSLGFIRYKIFFLDEPVQGIKMTLEKSPRPVLWKQSGPWHIYGSSSLHEKESLILSSVNCGEKESQKKDFSAEKFSRLSLGNHKAQDWDIMRKNCDWHAILPLWHFLGQMTPFLKSQPRNGTAILLDECQAALQQNAPEFILPHFKRLFLAGFESALSPRLQDSDYQGILNQTAVLNPSNSPLELLSEGSNLINSLFFQKKDGVMHLLPALPPEFHCGRLLNVECEEGQIDMEWTKNALRRVIFKAAKQGKSSFVFGRKKKKCRLRTSYKDTGISYLNGMPLDFASGQSYWFDNFIH